MRALVTGSDGFVGNWLCAHLTGAGDDVVAATAVDADVTDSAGIDALVHNAAPDVIYHLAGLANVAESWARTAADVRGECCRHAQRRRRRPPLSLAADGAADLVG